MTVAEFSDEVNSDPYFNAPWPVTVASAHMRASRKWVMAPQEVKEQMRFDQYQQIIDYHLRCADIWIRIAQAATISSGSYYRPTAST